MGVRCEYSFGALAPAMKTTCINLRLFASANAACCALLDSWCKYKVQTALEELVDEVDARRPLVVVMLADELFELSVQLRQPVRQGTWRDALPPQFLRPVLQLCLETRRQRAIIPQRRGWKRPANALLLHLGEATQALVLGCKRERLRVDPESAGRVGCANTRTP